VFLCGLIPVLITAVVAVYRPTVLTRLEHTVYDILVRSASPRPPGSGVVIVDVDERSLATVGQWPWGRDRVGELITRLRDLGAATVALDIVFAESDRARADEVFAARLREGDLHFEAPRGEPLAQRRHEPARPSAAGDRVRDDRDAARHLGGGGR